MTNFRDQIPDARRLIKVPGPEVALLPLLVGEEGSKGNQFSPVLAFPGSL